MWFELRKEDLSFVARAPIVRTFEAEVAASRAALFAAIADPAGWPSWFPGVREACYPSPPPYGVGTIRAAHVGSTHWVEELIAWDEGERFAWCVTRSSVPLAWAQVESFELAEARGATRVRWTLACEPRTLMKLGAPAAPLVMGRLFQRAMGNLGSQLAA